MAQINGRFSKRLSFSLLMGLALMVGSIGVISAFDTTSTTARIYGIYREATASSNSGATALGYTNLLSTDSTANAMLTSDGRPNGTFGGSLKGAIPSGGTVVYFFCINIEKPLDPMPADYNPATALSSEARAKIAYLISTYYNDWYPTSANASGNALNSQRIASGALQLAIWHYTDTLSVNNVYYQWSGYNGTSSTSLRNLAKAYVQAADANWGGYPVVDRLLFVPQTQTVSVGQPANFQVEAFNIAGNPLSGVVINLANDAGVLSSASVTTGAGGLTPTITLTGASPADAGITASAIRSSQIAGITYARVTNPGTYQYVILATKNSDEINDPNGSVTVTKASPTITTNASGAVALGGPIHDSATLSGGYAPSGSITFNLYGPNDAGCSSVIFSTANNVTDNGTYTSSDFSPTSAGTYRWIANYGGDNNNTSTANGCNGDNESVVLSPTSPAITTNASSGVIVGNPIHDSATLSGGYAPSGSITFNLYGPNDAGCSSVIFSTANNVTDNGTYTSSDFAPSAAGTYRWIANYGGDANNSATANGCNGANESVVLSPTSPAITTNASDAVVVGTGSIHDTATLSGGYAPSGTISFDLYGPGDTACATSLAHSQKTVTANGPYVSDTFTPTSVGTYRWIANYGGDTNNSATANGCNGDNESVVVSPTTPAISTNASSGVTVGNPIHDSATLSGATSGANGTITFNLYGPGDNTCTKSIFTSLVPVNGPSVYVSEAFSPTSAGTYRWIANYGGDANNTSTTNGCNGDNESVVVSQTGPVITTNASSGVTVGAGPIHDTATLSGGYAPNGTVTFNLYGPGDTVCATSLAYSQKTVTGNGTYESDSFSPTSVGTYRWIANYGGDTNNSATTNGCNGPNEAVVVSQTGPVITTNASPPLILGSGTTQDTATLSGGYLPSGSITFNLYGPNDTTCSSSIFSSSVEVSGNGQYLSDTFTPTSVGIYRWIANYGGDTNNAATANGCNGANESVTVSQTGPVINTVASSSVVLGAGSIHDTATLSGGYAPSGTISFDLYGPADTVCATSLAHSQKTVSGNGTYESDSFSPATAGTYRWVANYGGDTNNSATAEGCNAANESVVVSPAGPAVITNASSAVMVGNPIRDSATLSGGHNPTGLITFQLYGPGDATCELTALATSTASVSDNGTYASADFSPSAPGTYRWIANYGGDANNSATANGCNGDNESVVVSPTPTPTPSPTPTPTTPAPGSSPTPTPTPAPGSSATPTPAPGSSPTPTPTPATSPSVTPSHLPSPTAMPDTSTGSGGSGDNGLALLLFGLALLFGGGVFLASRRGSPLRP